MISTLNRYVFHCHHFIIILVKTKPFSDSLSRFDKFLKDWQATYIIQNVIFQYSMYDSHLSITECDKGFLNKS